MKASYIFFGIVIVATLLGWFVGIAGSVFGITSFSESRKTEAPSQIIVAELADIHLDLIDNDLARIAGQQTP